LIALLTMNKKTFEEEEETHVRFLLLPKPLCTSLCCLSCVFLSPLVSHVGGLSGGSLPAAGFGGVHSTSSFCLLSLLFSLILFCIFLLHEIGYHDYCVLFILPVYRAGCCIHLFFLNYNTTTTNNNNNNNRKYLLLLLLML